MKHFLITLIILCCIVTITAKEMTINPFVKSVLVPGWGQLSLDKSYGYAMLGSELALWSLLYYYTQEEKLRDRESYEYALNFAHIRPGEYSDQYFRDLAKFNSSSFDTGGYNAEIRNIAISLYPGDPLLQQQYIEQHIYSENMSWNWDSQQHRRKFSSKRHDMLELQDKAKVMTGIIIANHIISAIDILRQKSRWNNVTPYLDYSKKTVQLKVNITF